MRRRFMNISHINIDNYLTIEALEDGLTVSLSNNIFEYCIDGDGHWKKVMTAETESIDTGHMLSIRGEARYVSNSMGIGTFKISKKCNLKGNCLSILFKDNAANNYSLEYGKHSLAKLFYECEGIVEVSENFLPATTLASYCYSSMFDGCTSLTTAPELPATTLASYCYHYLFDGCTKLNYIKMLATDISASHCLSYWVNGVASTGTFVKNKNATWNVTGESGIPSGWTVVNDGEESGLTFPVTLYGTKLGTANDDLGIRVYNFIKNTKSSGDYLTESEVIAINATDGSRSETLYVQMVNFNENENQILLATNNDYWRCVLWDDGVLNTDYD